MNRQQVQPALLVATVLSGCLACGNGTAGVFRVEMRWGDAGIPSEPDATIFARVLRVRQTNGAAPDLSAATTLAEASPVGVDEQASLSFSGVPHGEARLVEVRVRESADPQAKLLRYGLSEPFGLNPGDDITVPVRVGIATPPNLEPVINSVSVLVDDAPCASGCFVRDAAVRLELATDTGVVAEISNVDTFPAAATERQTLSGAVNACSGTTEDPCRYRVEWNVNSGRDACGVVDRCERRVYVRFEDNNGIRSATEFVDLVVDRVPPSVTAAVNYLPSANNVLPDVSLASEGTTIVLTFVAQEEIRLPAEPTFEATTTTPSGTTSRLTFTRDADSVTPFGARYRAVVDSTHVDGRYTPSLQISDLAGNRLVITEFPEAPIDVKTSNPTLEIDQAAVSYIRAPVGNAAAEERGAFTIPAGPEYFALAPSDGLSGDSTLPASTFRLAGAGEIVAIRVWGDADRRNLISATILPQAGGAWAREQLRLSNLDTSAVFVTGFDRAGNESLPVPIRKAWFVASSSTVAFGASPHRATLSGRPRLPLEEQADVADRTSWAGLDGRAARASARDEWQRRDSTSPARRSLHATTFDSARGQLVMYGGCCDSTLERYADTWAWNGRRWTDVSPAGTSPGPLRNAAIAYDSVRGRVVLIGGENRVQQFSPAIWEWDGRQWTDITPSSGGPPQRTGAALTYDTRRRQLVLFGGRGDEQTLAEPLNDTWTYDGQQWTPVATVGPTPDAPNGHGLTYDHARDRVVLFINEASFDGLPPQTWEFDGTMWVDRTPSGPSPIQGPIAYDPELQRTLLQDGTTTWAWDGTTWSELTTNGPAAGPDDALTYDFVRRHAILIKEGEASATFVETWSFDGSTWRQRGPFASPSARSFVAMAFDESAGVTVLFGGAAGDTNEAQDDTWTYDGVNWSQVSLNQRPPVARFGHAMAYDSRLQQVTLAGGTTDGSASVTPTRRYNATGRQWLVVGSTESPPSFGAMAYDTARSAMVHVGTTTTWLLSGDQWSLASPASAPMNLTPVVAYDEQRGQVALLGGTAIVGLEDTAETWVWGGTNWAERNPTNRPPGRINTAMAYDRNMRRSVLFGGLQRSLRFRDTWAWNGTNWSLVELEGALPPARGAHTMTYDANRRRVVMFGGLDVAGRRLADTWELAPPTQASAQFAPQIPSDLLTTDTLTRAHIRASCGARFSPFGSQDTGAALFGWAVSGNGREPGRWIRLASNQVGAPITQRLTDDEIITATVNDVRDFIGPDGRIYLQCRPNGSSLGGVAELAVDYIEMRIEYTLP